MIAAGFPALVGGLVVAEATVPQRGVVCQAPAKTSPPPSCRSAVAVHARLLQPHVALCLRHSGTCDDAADLRARRRVARRRELAASRISSPAVSARGRSIPRTSRLGASRAPCAHLDVRGAHLELLQAMISLFTRLSALANLLAPLRLLRGPRKVLPRASALPRLAPLFAARACTSSRAHRAAASSRILTSADVGLVDHRVISAPHDLSSEWLPRLSSVLIRTDLGTLR